MRHLIIIILGFSPFLGYCQESNLGNWLIYFGNKKINSRWNWHHEVQYRNYDAIGNLEQLLLRTGIGYDLMGTNSNVLLGYGYILSENYIPNTFEKFEVHEHRLFQQFLTTQLVGRVKLQHRYRFEQRWIEEDFKLRFRYFLGLNIPVNNKELLDHTFYVSLYNEIFLNSKRTVFDRNRLYGGLGYRFNKTIRCEIGYMNQFLNNGNRDQINLVAFVNF